MAFEEARQRIEQLLAEFERTGEPRTLRRAVEAYRESASSIPAPDHPAFLPHQFNASRLLDRFFDLTADPAFLPDAARTARNALGAVHPDQPDRERMLIKLGDTLQTAYEWAGELSDLQLAVNAFRAARSGYPPGSQGDAACANRLCVALRLVYERIGDLDALRNAVELGRHAVSSTSIGGPRYDAFRASLGNALRAQYERNANGEVLDEALEIAQDVVAATPAGSSNHPIALNVLAATLRLEYDRTGELPVLRQAVEAGRDALNALQPPFLYRATYKMNLASHLRMLADRVDDRASAHEAVLLGREALEEFASDDPERPRALSVLSQALVVRARRDGDVEMLLDAVRLADGARDATSYDHPAYVDHLTSLINALMELYYRTKQRQFLDRALHAASNAAASTPPDHPDRAAVLTNLGQVLEAATHAGATGLDMTQAVRFARDAVEATSPMHPHRADLLSNLGDVLALQAEHTGDQATARECVNVYASAVRRTAASPIYRVRAAQRAARSALLAGHRNQALRLAETAVELLPMVIVRDVARADREHRLQTAFGLASTVAAAAISVGRPERAVELLEQTRGLILASTLETRGDLTELRTLAPDLAEPFDKLRRAVNALDHESAVLGAVLPTAELGARHRELAARRERLNQEWDRQLDRIRQRDGLERFLRPRLIDELAEQAEHGPIVYLTTHEQRGHALIVRDDPGNRVDVLALPPDVTASAVAAQVAELDAARSTAADRSRPAEERRAAQRRVLGVLGWIWDNIGEPVLLRLGHAGATPEDGRWPRIWWCPVGLLALLPLHAAGRHPAGSGADSVMDRVISSYTPSIRALAHVRERPPSPSSPAVVVAVPDAPECPPLDSAVLEADAIGTLIPDATVLVGTATDRDSVITALRNNGIAHLVCHGVADRHDPARSRLLLHDHLTHPLTVHDITRLHLESGELAYLSACGTSEGNPLQVDESTQLTAAFQLAGYRNVIGTLWPIGDRPAAAVARRVYAILTGDGLAPPDLTMVAEALHQATRQQRKQARAVPTRWAAYVHYGA
ncbi:CHAT domain-containing protein [Pseudonocardia acaciae]|uniref:CHAT domain-containing protein n=1 Tax=Pseudonocardia acaciae TaxID=551276 RepID=UPI000AD3E029|nr:CHAT domain-containing protein [Pseudonocardia acaciae]